MTHILGTIQGLVTLVQQPDELVATVAPLISELAQNIRYFLRPSFNGILLYIIMQQVIRLPLQEAALYKRSPDGWKAAMFVYNVAMMLYSCLSFLILSYTVFSRENILDGKEWEDKWHTIAMDAFYWSKYVEFIDTFFLILAGKEVSWLHYLHHIGAPLAWGICSLHQVPGTWIGSWVNSFVHTVMYMYYACTNRKWSFPLPKCTITVLQISQLIGCAATWVYFYGSHQKLSSAGGWFFFGYVVMCMGLFSNFFYVEYVTEKNGKKKREAKKYR